MLAPLEKALQTTPPRQRLYVRLPQAGTGGDVWEKGIEADLSQVRECTEEAPESKNVPRRSRRAGIVTPATLGKP